MKLSNLRRHWNGFARLDPYWAVLTNPDKAGGRWQVEEFFATGVAAIDHELRRVVTLQPHLHRGRALDFGCGVGRLSQALANHFEAVVGVDIAEQMLALARSHNRHGDKVNYVHNDRPDLAQWPDACFDFIYSDITLQHIEPVYSRAYMAEFVRVCAPGGVISFQVPALLPAPRRPRFSWWPPTLWMRFRRRCRQLVLRRPVMEMHAVPRAEVVAILEQSGAEILLIEANDAPGPEGESYRYIARKRPTPAS